MTRYAASYCIERSKCITLHSLLFARANKRVLHAVVCVLKQRLRSLIARARRLMFTRWYLVVGKLAL